MLKEASGLFSFFFSRQRRIGRNSGGVDRSRGECREFPPIPMSTSSIEARNANELYAHRTTEENSRRIIYKRKKVKSLNGLRDRFRLMR